MNVALVGPELEENLALRYLHASLSDAGHNCRIFDFHSSSQIESLAASIMAFNPELIGLSMVFTSRAQEYIDLSELIKNRGFTGHITAGGHFASFHAEQLLLSYKSLNTIVHGEGETLLVELANNLDSPQSVNNISYRGLGGVINRTAQRSNQADLDSLPWPTRTPPMHRYLNMPIANMLGSRGCFGNCDFCSISAWHRENGGLRFRFRAPDQVAKEMAYLYHDLGARIFNFHDDNFFHPQERDSINRFRAIKKYLKKENVGTIAVQVKARPDSISQPIVSALKEIGLFRVFLGVESNAVAGLKALGRGITRECNYKALDILKKNGIHTTFNLLMFEPEMTPGDFLDNVNMLTSYPEYPLNFGRVEVYSGTPLEKRLREENRLVGNYFGYAYLIKDPVMQTAFELFRKVFTGRNFDVDGMNLLSMRLDYYYHLLNHFYPHLVTADLTLKTKDLVANLNRNSAMLLKSIHECVVDHTNYNSSEIDQFGDGLLEWRKAYDNKSRKEFLELINEIENIAVKSRIANKSNSLPGLTAATAAAVLVVASMNCSDPFQHDWHVSEMIANPLDPVQPTWDNTTVLPQFMANTISGQIQLKYQDKLRQLTQQYNYHDKQLNVELMIDTTGSVIASRISVPNSPDSVVFTRELGISISKWEFSGVKGYGRCTMIITVANFPYPSSAIETDTISSHMYEMIGMPPDVSPSQPISVSILDTVWNNSLWDSFTPFDTNVVIAIDHEIDSVYYLQLNQVVNSFLFENRLDLDLDMILDALGKVTMFRIQGTNGESLDTTMVRQFSMIIKEWQFPFVKTMAARAGKCTIKRGFFKYDSHINEMIATPINEK